MQLKNKEFNKKSVCANFAHTVDDGKITCAKIAQVQIEDRKATCNEPLQVQIERNIKNIFKTDEAEEKSNVQKMHLANLYKVNEKSNMQKMHIANIFKNEELNKNSVVRNFRTTANNGNFENVIDKAKKLCQNSGQNIILHFAGVSEIQKMHVVNIFKNQELNKNSVIRNFLIVQNI